VRAHLHLGLTWGTCFGIYRFMVTPSFTSLMTWFVIFTNAMVIIYLLESFFLLREDLVLWSQDENRKGSSIYRFSGPGENQLRT